MQDSLNPDLEKGLDSNWMDPEQWWQAATHITVGVDVGSVSTQAVILADGNLLAFSNRRNGPSSRQCARDALEEALNMAGVPEDQIAYCVGTGYGRVDIPFSDRSITEISCHARGAHFIYGPTIRTVLDVGGQDIKIIHCDEKGKVVNFHMNDKCAAGTGRGMETFAELLGISLGELGDQSFAGDNQPAALSAKCVVYARAEAINLLREGVGKETVLAAYCQSMAANIFEVIEKLGVSPRFGITGGMAKNRGIIDRVVALTETPCLDAEWDPQIAGALGAAMFAHALAKKGKKRKKRG